MFSPLAEQVREVDVRARQSGLQCDGSPVFNFRLTIQMGITEHDADVVVRDGLHIGGRLQRQVAHDQCEHNEQDRLATFSARMRRPVAHDLI